MLAGRDALALLPTGGGKTLVLKFTAEMNHIWRGTVLDITLHIRRNLDRQQKNCESGVE